MESFVNNYYTQIGEATNEAERTQIKAEFVAKLQALSEEQRQQMKILVGERLNAFLETLAPIDSAIDQSTSTYNSAIIRLPYPLKTQHKKIFLWTIDCRLPTMDCGLLLEISHNPSLSQKKEAFLF